MADYDRVLVEFNAQIAQNPSQVALYKKRAKVYEHRGGSALWRSEMDVKSDQNYNLMLADYSAAIELAPKDAETYYLRGLFYYLRSVDKEKALEDFTRAIDYGCQPLDAAYCIRGEIFLKNQRFHEALSDFDQAVALGSHSAYCSRGSLHTQLGRYQEALEDYRRYWDGLTEGTWHWGHDVDLLFGQLAGLLEERIRSANYSLSSARINKSDPLIHMMQEVLAKTEGDVRKGLESRLGTVRFILRRGPDVEERGETGFLLALNRLLIDLVPMDYSLYVECARYYRSLNDHEAALSFYTTAIDLSGDEEVAGKIYGSRADVFETNLKDYQKAAEDYTVAIRLAPGDDNVRHWLHCRAWCYYRLKDWRRAKADYEALLRFGGSFENEFILDQIKRTEERLDS